MVKKFEFSSNLLELDIAGEVFQIDTTNPRLIESAEKYGIKMQEYSKKAEEIAKEHGNAKAMEDMIQICVDAIDVILGEGATKKIFKERKVNFFDCIDVINFVTAEIEKSRENKLQKYSPNRAQRRAKK
jgi:hypothetical protein|nr:MAG TPA: tail assembly chaperone [Caudoviricetes sp.]